MRQRGQRGSAKRVARLDIALPVAALRQALTRRGRPQGLLYHSDCGIQDPSARYRQILQQQGLERA